jgi:propanol-preferring alcohol dehydrogenase
MKAAYIQEYKQPLIIADIAAPVPEADEVLLRVAACGVCHSDLHLADADWPHLLKIMQPNLILGHEVVGAVVAKGAEVQDLNIGDRVGVAWIHWACGACELCLEGLDNLCPQQLITGLSVHGGYAELMRAKASHAVPVPDALTDAEAAPLFCAGVTVHRALKLAEIPPGRRVVVSGVGGLGHLAVQLLVNHYGAEVIAVDIDNDKLKLAQELGAAHTFNAATENAVRAIRKLGGAHFAVVTATAKAAYDEAIAYLRPSGTIVVVGLPAEPLSFTGSALSSREARIVASSVGALEDMRETLQLAAAGKMRCRVETRPLEQANEALTDLKRGAVTGRLVLTMAETPA